MGKQTLAVEQNNNQTYTGPNQNNMPSENQRKFAGNGNKTILYGWKKHCLYFIIFLLMVLISVNLALTLWILKVLEVSKDGMGQMRIVEGGIQLDGQAIILDELKTSFIKSRHGQPLTFESSRNLTFNTRDADGFFENQIFLGHDKFEVQSKKFKVMDNHGNTLFYADRDFVEIAADTLRVEGDGGLVFKESIQTPIIKAEPGRDLKLEAPTRGLDILASKDVFIQSSAGSIAVSSLNDIKLSGKNIRIDAESIKIPNMKTIQQHSSHEKSDRQMYQVCICDTGRLFLAASHLPCSNDSDVCN